MVYLVHRAYGLPGLLFFRVGLSLALLAAFHRLAIGRQARFLPALGLAAAAMLALLPMLNLRPWLFTILFSTWTLDAVLRLREGRAARRVWLLPLGYVLWANIHIQFI